MGSSILPGDKSYDFAIKELDKQKESTIEFFDFGVVAFISIPVFKMKQDDNFFKKVLEVCEKKQLHGPITLVPLNEFSEVLILNM